jgi:hypothetical protein
MDEKPNTKNLELKPFAVPISTAQMLLGEKSVAALYNDLGRGADDPLRLVAVKDGTKTLITLESIERRQQSLPFARIKPPKPRAPREQPGVDGHMSSAGAGAKSSTPSIDDGGLRRRPARRRSPRI